MTNENLNSYRTESFKSGVESQLRIRLSGKKFGSRSLSRPKTNKTCHGIVFLWNQNHVKYKLEENFGNKKHVFLPEEHTLHLALEFAELCVFLMSLRRKESKFIKKFYFLSELPVHDTCTEFT